MPSAVRHITISSALITLALLAVSSSRAEAQTPAYPWEGEVSGTNVYVRSGAGANWYPTTKLNTGDRVLVLGEKYGWYQITPPSGSFSYIDTAMVDRKAGAKKGTVKQDRIYVRAGSTLEQRKNATQLVLNKGDSVDIIGEAEGFYKIAPPPGATLYISKQYVKPVEPRLTTGLVERHLSTSPPPVRSQPEPAAPERVATAPPQPAATPTQRATVPEPIADDQRVAAADLAPDAIMLPEPLPDDESIYAPEAEGVEPSEKITTAETPTAESETRQPPKKSPATPAKTAIDAAPADKIEPGRSRYQAMLAMCESELVSLLEKPLSQQDPGPLLAKYEEIAAQSDEYVPSEVAKIRVRQLKDRMRLRETHLALGAHEQELSAYRANMDAERMKIMRRRVEEALDTFDLEGELRRSLAFAPENRRFRLVDPESDSTIAYVDIPRSVEENPEFLIGRKVGIHVAGQTFSPSARVPIAVARRVVDLTPRQSIPSLQPISREKDDTARPDKRGSDVQKSDIPTISIPRKTAAAADGELEPE